MLRAGSGARGRGSAPVATSFSVAASPPLTLPSGLPVTSFTIGPSSLDMVSALRAVAVVRAAQRGPVAVFFDLGVGAVRSCIAQLFSQPVTFPLQLASSGGSG